MKQQRKIPEVAATPNSGNAECRCLLELEAYLKGRDNKHAINLVEDQDPTPPRAPNTPTYESTPRRSKTHTHTTTRCLRNIAVPQFTTTPTTEHCQCSSATLRSRPPFKVRNGVERPGGMAAIANRSRWARLATGRVQLILVPEEPGAQVTFDVGGASKRQERGTPKTPLDSLQVKWWDARVAQGRPEGRRGGRS